MAGLVISAAILCKVNIKNSLILHKKGTGDVILGLTVSTASKALETWGNPLSPNPSTNLVGFERRI